MVDGDALLPSQDAAKRLAMTTLSERVGVPVRITYTDNRSTMLSFRQRQGIGRLRVHRIFAEAPDIVWHAITYYVLDKDPQAGSVLDHFIAARQPQDPGLDSPKLRPLGTFHDLEELLEELNGEYFHNGVQAKITWGRNTSSKRRRSLQLGCFVPSEGLIRIHPCLDQAFVPRYYVRWVVYHEMLHEIFGVEKRGKRRVTHPPEFVAIEESYPEYERCKTWEDAHIEKLMRYQAR